MVDLKDISDVPVNSHVVMTTKLGQKIESHVYCHGLGDSVIMKAGGSSPYHKKFTIVKPSHIQEVTSSDMVDHPHNDMLPVVDAERTKMREDKAVKLAILEAEKIGEGVSEEAQMIFNALSKTLPCRWDKKKIVVLEEIEIDEPYAAEQCTSKTPAGDSTAIMRVRKVLDEERKKLFG